MENDRTEPGSFRDRQSRVFYRDGGVFRYLSAAAAAEWQALTATRFFKRRMVEGSLVETRAVEGFDPSAAGGYWAAVLRHETIPFISYPYEWTFGMLKDAALLSLDLLDDALNEGMTVKDASAYNVQWLGVQPVFIDIPSFERLKPGAPWAGYLQFCRLFLYPLLLQAYKDVPFQPWLRGQLDGIEPMHFVRLMSLRDWLRPGVMTHVVLHSKLQATYAAQLGDMRRALKVAGFNSNLIRSNVRGLKQLVDGLTLRVTKSEWSDYADQNSYEAADREAKVAFVRTAVQSRRWMRIWDLGCNTGDYARIAAENAEYVVAMDADPLCIERFYLKLRAERHRTILPLVMNLVDASPGLGWQGKERKTLVERGRPDLVLCLALIHHIVLRAHVPLAAFVESLAALGAALVIEFVTKEDPMARRLLQNKQDDDTDYDLPHFEKYLCEFFHIDRRQPLTSGVRTLYFAAPRTSG